MTDIVVVVDAQNSFCHPDGVSTKRFAKTEKKLCELQQTIARLKLFLEKARVRNIPVVYLCANKNTKNVALWNLQIHNDLSPQKNDEVFWRNEPWDYGALNKTVHSLLERFADPHFFLCGFYANKCVAAVAMHFVERGIPISIIADCVYPSLTKRMETWYTGYIARKWPKPIDINLISFETSAAHSAEWNTKT